MNVKLSRKAEKQFLRLDESERSRVSVGIRKLRKDPPEGDIKKIKGSTDKYRLRLGDNRIFFDKTKDKISITRIVTRGQAYKNRR